MTLSLLGGLVVLLGPRAIVAWVFRDVQKENLLGKAGRDTDHKGRVRIEGAKTILMVGVDSRPDSDDDDLTRADSIIVTVIPEDHESAYLVSVPRDVRVQIPAFDNGRSTYPGGYAKINEAYAYGGEGLTGDRAKRNSVELLALTLKKEYGFIFDAAAIVDFDGFREVVKALGGVDMNVDQETVSVHVGFNEKGEIVRPFDCTDTHCDPVPGVTPKVYHPGFQHLDAHESLDYVRQRKTLPRGDYDRQRHQQQFIKAIIREVVSGGTLTNPVKLSSIVNTLTKSITIDDGGIGLEDWVAGLRGISVDRIITLKTNDGDFHPCAEDESMEELDEVTRALFVAIRDEEVTDFVSRHPNIVMRS